MSLPATDFTSADQRRRDELLDRPRLEAHQLARLNHLLEAILPHNRFYAAKFADAPTNSARSPSWPSCR